MKHSLVLAALLSTLSLAAAQGPTNEAPLEEYQDVTAPSKQQCPNHNMKPTQMHQYVSQQEPVLAVNKTMLVSVVGQGVAPMNTDSPAQAYALAKRAAIADGYRLIAEKVKGVRVDGQDIIKNMMVKRSTVRTAVAAMVQNANLVETSFKDGLCEVEMEILISYAQFQ